MLLASGLDFRPEHRNFVYRRVLSATLLAIFILISALRHRTVAVMPLETAQKWTYHAKPPNSRRSCPDPVQKVRDGEILVPIEEHPWAAGGSV